MQHLRLRESVSKVQALLTRSPEAIAAQQARDRDEARRLDQQRREHQRQSWNRLSKRIGRRYEEGLDCWQFHGEQGDRQRQFHALEQVKDYAAKIVENVRSGIGLVLFGAVGTGKDLMLSHLMRTALIDGGFNVEWRNGVDVFGDVRDRMETGGSESRLVESLCSPHVLAISDPLPPWGSLTPFQAQILFRVIDRRYRAGRPTWATLNTVDGAEAADRLGQQIVDRLRHDALCLSCQWPSFRKAKNG